MKIAIIGSRGIPAKYGGFETFAEEISVNLQKRHDIEVIVICDAEQSSLNDGMNEYKGVPLIYSKYSKSKHPLLFYLDSHIKAARNADIVYACGVGGGYWGFTPRMFGKILVTNPDGIGWERAKWSWPVKKALRSMYYFSVKFSDYLICDSVGIEEAMRNIFSCDRSFVIEYGAYINEFIASDGELVASVLMKYGLQRNKYHLVVARLEPENHVDMIIRGYQGSSKHLPLMIVGNLKNTSYVDSLVRMAGERVRFLDGIYDRDELSILRANAYDYIHGHSVGGTNPSLLEAMASANLCVCHDNIYNREVVKENGFYFDSAEKLSEIISNIENNQGETIESRRAGTLERFKNFYTWEIITDKYHQAFKKISEEFL